MKFRNVTITSDIAKKTNINLNLITKNTKNVKLQLEDNLHDSGPGWLVHKLSSAVPQSECPEKKKSQNKL